MKRTILILFLMIASLVTFGQTSPCLTHEENFKLARIIIECKKQTMSGLEKDTIIGLHEAKIKNLTIIEGIRSEQLINANIENAKLNKEIKRLKRAIFIHKVVFVAGIVATIWLLK